LDLPDGDVPGLIKRTLFKLDPTSAEADPEVRQIVYERFCDAFALHLDDPTEAFNQWFWATTIKQFAKKVRAPGGKLDHNGVRIALLNLGWEAYEYVAGCLGIHLQDFAKALAPPLTPREVQIFGQMHLQQPHFGGLPLILLAERLDFAEVAMRRVIENPSDRRQISVLHRMLENYAVLARERREADTRSKDRAAKGANKTSYSLDDNRDSAKNASAVAQNAGEFGFEVASKLALHQGVRCHCATSDDAEWEAVPIEDGEELRGPDAVYTIRLYCKTCKFAKYVELLVAELSAMIAGD
jgi:hypothetical protein